MRSAQVDDENAAGETTGTEPEGNAGQLPRLMRKSAVWQAEARAEEARSLKKWDTVSRPVAFEEFFFRSALV